MRGPCPRCGEEKLLPHSCKARGLCPSCQKKRALLWAERMVEEVLPRVPYVQLVFTIPKMLRPYFLWDRSLYGALSRAAYDSTQELFQTHFPTVERAVPAMVISPQSFGSLLNAHPHLHSVCSLGVFDREGKFHGGGDLDFAQLEEMFRQKRWWRWWRRIESSSGGTSTGSNGGRAIFTRLKVRFVDSTLTTGLSDGRTGKSGKPAPMTSAQGKELLKLKE